MDFTPNALRKAAVEIASIGGDSTLHFFKKSFDLQFKDDESPVTNADRNAEKLMRSAIKNRYPEHGIIGEEFGSENEDADIAETITDLKMQESVYRASLATGARMIQPTLVDFLR